MGILTVLSALRGPEVYMRNKFNEAINTKEWKSGNSTLILLRTELAKEYIANHPDDFDYAGSSYVEEHDCYDEVIFFKMYKGVFSYKCTLHTAEYIPEDLSILFIEQ